MKLAIAYKNFAANRGISHIGLGVTAMTNAKVLQSAGLRAEVWPVTNNVDVVNRIKAAALAGDPVTHLVIQAPWLSTYDLSTMVHAYPDITFAVVSHSNVGFLQADPSGVRLLRQASNLSVGVHNFHVAANSRKFADWWKSAYRMPALYLPNLYYMDSVERPARRWHGGTLRVGAFGAVRPLKNFMTAAAAALQIGSRVQADLEMWFSGGRTEGGGEVVWRAINEMFAGLRWAKLVQAPWAPWPEFRQTVRHMHLLLQPSYTESFNMVTADGIAMGVPSVVSDAIDWAPAAWKAAHDDARSISDVGVRLLNSRSAMWRGRRALATHNREGLQVWQRFLAS
jgi:glycosyltransferase involved in cell wall biosynthesis